MKVTVHTKVQTVKTGYTLELSVKEYETLRKLVAESPATDESRELFSYFPMVNYV